MAIISILDKQLDSRKNGDDCAFNGYLEDYLNLGDEIGSPLKEAFEQILEKDPEVKICVGLKSEINRDAISNQIIRYKDADKLMGKAMVTLFCESHDATGVTHCRAKPASMLSVLGGKSRDYHFGKLQLIEEAVHG